MSNKINKAFTLIELSIVLVIAAIITASLLGLAFDKTEADKIKETEIILDKIEQAIANYFAEYGSIPCPADATLSLNDPNFGLALRHNTNSYWCVGGVNGEWFANTKIYQNYQLGLIPSKELKIPDELAFDSWGRRITYAMVEMCNTSANQYVSSYINTDIINPNYNTSYNFLNACAFPNKASASQPNDMAVDGTTFTIKDASGSIVNSTAGIPYVLISHGKNGHGAYPKNGGTTRINAAANNSTTTAYNLSADEIQNAHMDASGANIIFTNSFLVQKAPNYTPGANYFDDIVRYKTKEQLIRKSGRFPAQKTIADNIAAYQNIYAINYCTLANSIINNNASSYCSIINTTDNARSCVNYLNAMAKQVAYLCS